MVRHIKAPLNIPAVLPHGPMREQLEEFDSLVEIARSIERNYTSLAERTTHMLQGLQGYVPSEQTTKEAKWEDGPKFVEKRRQPNSFRQSSHHPGIAGLEKHDGLAPDCPSQPRHLPREGYLLEAAPL